MSDNPPLLLAAPDPELLPLPIPQPPKRGTGRPFTPGDARIHRGGRPKRGQSVTDLLRDKADKGKLATALLALAYKGDVTALRYVYDRLDGTPVQRTEDVTPDALRIQAGVLAQALGVPVEDVLAQYEELKRLAGGA